MMRRGHGISKAHADDDRTGRWLVLYRNNHKDGGFFWSGPSGWVDGSTPKEALDSFLEEHPPNAGVSRYAVLSWENASIFRVVAETFEV